MVLSIFTCYFISILLIIDFIYLTNLIKLEMIFFISNLKLIIYFIGFIDSSFDFNCMARC